MPTNSYFVSWMYQSIANHLTEGENVDCLNCFSPTLWERKDFPAKNYKMFYQMPP